MRFAVFDLDHTLLGGDTDELWGEFLVDRGLLRREAWSRERARHVADYRAGTLDIEAFLAYALRPLKHRARAERDALRDEFANERLIPALRPAARALVARHRDAGEAMAIATATNSFLTEPVAQELGAHALLATEPELEDGCITGRLRGEPCFREGKLNRVSAWIRGRGSLGSASFYSDSHNDLPLLQAVGRPVAVDPDPVLRAHALEAGWTVLSLRDPATP